MFADFLIRMLFPSVCSRLKSVSRCRLCLRLSRYGCPQLLLLFMEGSQTRNAQNSQPFLSVVMPVFREAAHLPAILANVRSFLDQCNLPYELMLVDDGSPDDTWRVIRAEAKTFQAMRALRLSRNFGKESALCAGPAHRSFVYFFVHFTLRARGGAGSRTPGRATR